MSMSVSRPGSIVVGVGDGDAALDFLRAVGTPVVIRGLSAQVVSNT
jgi:hypothetical protein